MAQETNLVVTAFPTRSPANPGFVHLNMGLGCPPILSWLGRTMPERSLWRI